MILCIVKLAWHSGGLLILQPIPRNDVDQDLNLDILDSCLNLPYQQLHLGLCYVLVIR